MSKSSIFMRGIIRENPVLVLLLALCPALAVSSIAFNAIGLGAATTFVLLCSNIIISMLRKVIPDKVRIPSYIVVIAGFVALTQMLVEAYAFELHLALGIFLPLIASNCLIFARAEIFASKNTVFNSVIDALGMGVGFTLALFFIAAIREALGNGTLTLIALGDLQLELSIPVLSDFNIPIMTLAPGGFIAFALLIAVINKLTKGEAFNRKGQDCLSCPMAVACGKGGLIK